jgi:hypothetical protein
MRTVAQNRRRKRVRRMTHRVRSKVRRDLRLKNYLLEPHPELEL